MAMRMADTPSGRMYACCVYTCAARGAACCPSLAEPALPPQPAHLELVRQLLRQVVHRALVAVLEPEVRGVRPRLREERETICIKLMPRP